MSFLDAIQENKPVATAPAKTGSGFLAGVLTSTPQEQSAPAPKPSLFIAPPVEAKPMPGSTPAVISKNQGTGAVVKSVLNTAKDVVTGNDNTTGGVIRNTLFGLPKATLDVGKNIAVGLKDQFTAPSDEQKNYESTMLPYAPKSSPVTRVLTAPGVATARIITRFINPGLQPIANDLAEIRAINEKGGIADQVSSGKIPPSVFNEFAVLHKTNPQIVGDVAQAVLTAYAGSEAPGVVSEAKNLGFLDAVKSGFTKGLPVGELFGGAQSASAGQTNPLEVLGTVGTSGLTGGILGAITSGAIPVSKEVMTHVIEAKKLYDSMTPEQRQGGYIRNPLFREPKPPVETPVARETPPVVEPTPQEKPQSFSPEKYVEEQTLAREKARQAENPTLFGKVGNFLKDAKTKLVDFTAPIEDVLNATTKKNNITLLPENDIHNQIDRVLRSPTLAGQFAKDHGIVDVIKSVDNLDNLDQYLIAKHAIELDTRGITTGRDLAKDQALVKSFAPKYEASAKIVSDYSHKLLDYSVETGLISKELADTLKARYPDYVPFQRVFSEIEQSGNGSGAGGVASLSKQTAVQSIEGSTRAIESPIESLLAKTNDVFKQGEKNVAGKILAGYKDLPGNPFQLTPLRTTENVTKRIELYSEAKDLKPVQRKAENIVRSNARELRQLQTELNQLNKEGLNTALKTKTEPAIPQKVSSTKTTNIPEKPAVMFFDKNDIPTRGTEAVPAKRFIENQPVTLSSKEAKAYVEQLIQDKNIDLEAIKRKIATREPKVAELITKIEQLREEFQGVKDLRGGLMDEARLLKDAESRGMSTISFFDNGVKNIYETTPAIAQASKSLNVQQLNILGKMFALPTRIARVGITGINLPFIGANIAKDAVTAFINSDHGLKTSIANPVNFVKSLFSAIGHDKLYEEMVRAGGAGTSFDISRDQVKPTVESIRAGRNIGTKILYTVKHPSELLRAVENIIGRGEEFTRIQQYRGTKQAELAKGATEKSATTAGARQAREATVNFARRGEWGSVLNSAFLYLNAGIQGTRTLLGNLKEKPLQTGAKIAVAGLFPMAMATTWNLSDPERKKAYEDIPDYEKQNNIIIVPPHPTQDAQGKWNVIKIPLSQEINNLMAVPRRAIEQAYGLDPVNFGDFAKALIGTVSPITPDKGSILSTLTPQAIKPTIEGATNKNLFTGYPQVSKTMEKLSPANQIKPSTSGTAIEVAHTLGLSPIKVEEWIKGTFGGVGSQALNILDRVQKALGNKNIQVGGQDILDAITARFNKASGGKADDKAVNEITTLLQQQADKGNDLKTQAESLDAELSKLPPEEARARFAQINKENPALGTKLKSVAEDRKLGLSYEEKLMKQLQVTNGERAKYIDQQIMKLPADQRKTYYADLVKKKLVSPEVAKQLKQLRAKAPAETAPTESKPTSMNTTGKKVKQMAYTSLGAVKDLFMPKTAYADTIPQKKYSIRNNDVSESDLQEAKAIIFGEVSNRTPEKQKLEAQTILNTAFNRMDEYRKKGKEMTLTQVLQMPNQYQAYKKPLYNRFKSGKFEELDKQKLDAIESALNDVRGGNFINNIGGDVSYTHLADGRIKTNSKKLFK